MDAIVRTVFKLCFTLCCIFQPILSQESCVTRSVYYVSSRTGANSADCLRPDQRDHPCASLSYLMKISIHRCVTITILHDFQVNHTVLHFDSSWKNVTLEGASNTSHSVNLRCIGNSGIKLVSVTSFSLQHIQFRGCSFKNNEADILLPFGSFKVFLYTSVLITKSADVSILNCSFDNHIGSGLLMVDVFGTTSVKHSNFTGNRQYLKESKPRSGGIVIRLYTLNSNTFVVIENCQFLNNVNKNITCAQCGDYPTKKSPQHYGGALDFIRWNKLNDSQNLTFSIENCAFIGNEAPNGGAASLYFTNNTNMIILNSNFTNNRADCQGGAIMLAFNLDNDRVFNYLDQTRAVSKYDQGRKVVLKNCHFISNAANSGGAISISQWICGNTCSHYSVSASNSLWYNNSASGPGSAVSLSGPDPRNTKGYNEFFLAIQFSDCNLENNRGTNNSYGTISAQSAELIFSNSFTNFSNNHGTALALHNSHAIFQNDLIFSGNTGNLGGAIYIDGNATIEIKPLSNVRFANNTASVWGGAVYSQVINQCTFNLTSAANSSISFRNNSADSIQQSIYIENLGECGEQNKLIMDYFCYDSPLDWEILLPIYSFNITLTLESHEVMLGEIFNLKPFGITDIFGRTSVGIGFLRISSTVNSSYHLVGPTTISIDNYTHEIEFMIAGPRVAEKENITLDLFFDRHVPLGISKKEINLTIVPCRIGYKYVAEQNECICQISTDNVQCVTHRHSICVKRHYWFSGDGNEAYPCPSINCIFMTEHCPNQTGACSLAQDYCYVETEDSVCQQGRSKFLCSKRADDSSFTFAGVKCTSSATCNAKNTALLLLALLTYWILFLLVLLLSLSFKLSVGSGFMYGIVYFFSVATIYTRSSELFSEAWLQVIMHIGTALTLLDPELLGYVDICFAEKWNSHLYHELFRFATPVFIMSAIGLLVIMSRYFPIPRRLSFAENSPIHAICIFILLSYTSISYTSLKLLIPMSIQGNLMVQIDPTVPYFGKTHAPFAIAAICAELFFCIPLCFLFLFAPLISRRVNLVRFRLKAIVDEFQACYKPAYRWYAGFYFLARQVIYLLRGIISGPFPHSNNILTSVNVLVLLIHTSIQPYSNKWLNILDTILLTDIAVLSLTSPVKTNTHNSINDFFYNVIISYSLILVPVISLLGVNTFVLFNKFAVYRKVATQRNSLQVQSTETPKRYSSKSLRNPNSVFNGNHSNSAYREPLLEDWDSSDTSKQQSASYGTISHRLTNTR